MPILLRAVRSSTSVVCVACKAVRHSRVTEAALGCTQTDWLSTAIFIVLACCISYDVAVWLCCPGTTRPVSLPTCTTRTPLTHAHMRASLSIFQEHESLVLAHSRGSIIIGHEGEVASSWAAPEDTVVNVLIHDAQGQYVTGSSSAL